MSSIDTGEPQCVQDEAVPRSIGAPQFEQFTIWMFSRSSSSCCGESGRMKFFSRRKLKR
jgi:hypothetical protein